MARSRATIHCSIWDPNGHFRLQSGRAQRLYLLILTQGDLSLCGVCALTIDRWARLANDTSPSQVRKALQELVEDDYVLVDKETQEVWVRTFTKHDGVLRQPNVIVSMSRDFEAIQSVTIREAFLHGLPDTLLDGSEDGSVHGLPDGYRDRLGVPFLEGVLRTRARAPSPSPTPSPMVVPLPQPKQPNPSKSKNKTKAPGEFIITPPLREWVTKNNLTSVDLDTETQKFLDHHAAKDNEFADWNRAWQSWIRTGDGWAKERKSKTQSTHGDGYVPANQMTPEEVKATYAGLSVAEWPSE